MDAEQRLLDLVGEANFKNLSSSASVEEFKEIARYNLEQYARIEVIGDHHHERILNLMCLVLAEKLLPLAFELKVMNRRMYRRKAQKAGRGEYVGEPIPAGFMLPITGRKPSGEYEYGKMEPHPPHAEIVKRVLEEYVRQGGSCLKTSRALNGLTIPFFSPELQYMERLSSLRTCPKMATGYKITWNLIRGLATNLKMIGIWQWGSADPIIDNHQPAVTQELFLEAY